MRALVLRGGRRARRREERERADLAAVESREQRHRRLLAALEDLDELARQDAGRRSCRTAGSPPAAAASVSSCASIARSAAMFARVRARRPGALPIRSDGRLAEAASPSARASRSCRRFARSLSRTARAPAATPSGTSRSAPPADSPAIVTFDGSPPNAAMLRCTQRSASIWSSRP